MPVTGNRKTIAQVDVGEIASRRPDYHYPRRARKIGPGPGLPQTVAPSTNVFCTGDAWLLKPIGSTDVTEFLKLDTPAGSRFFGPTDANTAAGIQTALLFKPEFSIPGIGADPDYVPQGLPAFQKGIPAGVDASTQTLAADAAAYPSPTPPTVQGYPLDRVLSGTHTFQERAPWRILYDEPSGVPPDSYLTFFFGGQADVLEVGHSGGEFALMIRGNREALLYERDKFRTADHGWRVQTAFPLTGPDHSVQGPVKQSLTVIPYARDRIFIQDKAFSSNLTTVGTLPFFSTTFFAFPASSFASLLNQKLWLDQPTETGHTHLHAVTGMGTVRLDIQRTHLDLVAIASMVYPAFGRITDTPFLIPHALPAGSPIKVTTDGFTPPGTAIAAFLFDARTGAAVPFDVGTGTFSSIAGQSAYFLEFTLVTSDGLQTPVLWGYDVYAPGVWVTNTRIPAVTSWLHEVAIRGPDLDPADEQAVLHINDPDNSLVVLRVRDRVRSIVSVVDTTTGQVAAHLGEYESIEQDWRRRGKPSYQWPTPDWWECEGAGFRGLWARIMGQYFEGLNLPFNVDPTAAPDVNGLRPPMKWTDIVRLLFSFAGVPADELDIPDIPLRMWVGAQGLFEDMTLHPGVNLGDAILKIVHDYLGGMIVRDPCAGSRGMWRLLFGPTSTNTNYLASFLTSEPGLGTPVDVMNLRSYSAAQNVAPFQDGTYHHRHVAPEFSKISVLGIAPGTTNGYIKSVRENPNAFNSGHPDYLGFYLPFVRKPDPALPTVEACNWVRDRYYEVAGHGRDWWEGRAALLLVRDTQDPLQNSNLLRPLRRFDLCTVAGTRAMIMSANPRWRRSDEQQFCDYEGIFLV